MRRIIVSVYETTYVPMFPMVRILARRRQPNVGKTSISQEKAKPFDNSRRREPQLNINHDVEKLALNKINNFPKQGFQI